MKRYAAALVAVFALGLGACQQDDTPPQWTQIGEWEGTDSIRTRPFTMEGDTLRVAWENRFGPIAGGTMLQVFVLDSAGVIDTLLVNWAGQRTDTAHAYLEAGKEYSLILRPTNGRFAVSAHDKR